MIRIDYGKPALEVDTAKCHGEQEEPSSTSPNTTLSSTIERLKGKLQQQGTEVAEVKSGPLTEATARAQTVLELLLSAGLAPHQPISILQRVSGQSVDDNSCSKTTVQLLLEQVQQLRQLKSRLSLQHQQVLSLSPPLRRHAGPPDPVLPGVTDTQSYSALLALLAQLPPSQLVSLEHQLKTSQNTNSAEKPSPLQQSPPRPAV